MSTVEKTELALADRQDRWPEWPYYALIDDIRPPLEALLAAERPFALATLVEVEGSSPRPIGCQMLIAEDGRVWGYVSGGCVEADLALRAQAVLRKKTCEIVRYGRGSGNWDIQLACGGSIGVLVQRIEAGNAALHEIVSAGKARRPAALVIDLNNGSLSVLVPDAGREIPENTGRGANFVGHYAPVIRLLIIGGDPVALALSELAKPLGMEVHINRPSGPPEPPRGLAPGAYYAGTTEEFLLELRPDPWTAIVCVSHDIDLDHAVLRKVLPGPAFYVGALGSRRWRAERLDRLRADGVPETTLAQLSNPVGLDIGAGTAAQIALSVLADIVARRNGDKGP